VIKFLIIKDRWSSEAYSLVKSDSYSVSDIAIIVGYSDLATFSKAFKKRIGKSPKLMMD